MQPELTAITITIAQSLTVNFMLTGYTAPVSILGLKLIRNGIADIVRHVVSLPTPLLMHKGLPYRMKNGFPEAGTSTFFP